MVELAPAPTPSVTTVGPGTPKVRYAALDGLRFLAAFAVVAFHYTARITSTWDTPVAEVAPTLFRFTKFGYFGVDLFFVISGFVILMSAWGRPLSAFVASRVSRLYPAYWASVLLTAGIITALGARWLSLGQVAVNLSMFQTAFGVDHVDGVYWTLWAEMRFYALLGVFLLVGVTTTRVMIFATVWPILASLSMQSGNEFLQTVLVAPHASLFAGGMLIYLLARNGHSLIVWLLLLGNIVWSVPSAGADAAKAILNTTGAPISSAAEWVVVVACFGLVIAVVLTPLSRIRWSWLTLAGALTYPLYLLHDQIGLNFIQVTQNHLGVAGALTFSFFVSLALAFGVHYLIEKPFAPRVRRLVASELQRFRSS